MEAGGETEVQEPGGTGEADGSGELSEDVAVWLEAPVERFLERICKQCGAFEMPKMSSQCRVLAYHMWFVLISICFFFLKKKLKRRQGNDHILLHVRANGDSPVSRR